VKDLLKLWDAFVEEVRSFFREKGYLEVSTPYLLPFPNPDAHVEALKVKVKERGEERLFWLHASPEPTMKKLLARHKRDIFQVAKVFRNGEWGKFHRVEFHMLEWYAVGCDYRYLIVELKELMGRLIGVREFKVFTVEEAFEKVFGKPLPKEKEGLKKLLKEKRLHFEEGEDWETLFFRAFIEIERALGEEAFFLIDFPEEMAALAKVKDGKAERLELFYRGVELANGWTEERDPEEVRRRLKREAQRRGIPLDEEFVKVHGELPPCAGCSLGLDRLFTFYAGLDEIPAF